MRHLPVPTRRGLVTGAWVVAFAIIGLIGYLLITVIHLTDNDTLSVADRTDLRQELADQEAKTEVLAIQLEALGETPVVKPDADLKPGIQYVPVTGKPGATGPVGPSGPAGENGRTPDPIPGPAGKPGASGAPGDTITGPAGPAGKDGTNGTDGKDGPQGPSGTPGKDGRGIADAVCGDDARWIISWTDGTTSDAGQCRASLIPDPDPSPAE